MPFLTARFSRQPSADWLQSTQLSVVAGAARSSRRPNQRRGHMGSTRLLFSVCVIRGPWRRGLHPPRRTEPTCGRKKQTNKKNTRLWQANGPISKVSLQSPSHFLHCLLGRLDLEPHTRGRGRKRRWFRGVEPWSLASVQNQPFLPEGRTLSPSDWRLILFYTGIEL